LNDLLQNGLIQAAVPGMCTLTDFNMVTLKSVHLYCGYNSVVVYF